VTLCGMRLSVDIAICLHGINIFVLLSFFNDRMTMNNALKKQDVANYQNLVQNWEIRRAEEEQSLQNVDRWRQEVYSMRIENIKILKTSKMLSQKLVEDSKRDMGNGNGRPPGGGAPVPGDDSMSSGSSFAQSDLWADPLGGGGGDRSSTHHNFATSMNSSSVVSAVVCLMHKCRCFYLFIYLF
jgi:hypothetical protein